MGLSSKQVDLQKYEEGGIILTTEITRGGIELGKKAPPSSSSSLRAQVTSLDASTRQANPQIKKKIVLFCFGEGVFL